MSYWKDKVTVITGGSAGLGLAIASGLAEQGAKLVLAARRAEPLNQRAGELSSRHKVDVLTVPTDITSDEQVEKLIRQTVDQHGRIDALFNCAGRSTRGDLNSTTAADFADLMELNFFALVRCTHAALPHLLKTKGHVVNIGSLASKSAAAYLGAYPPSKFAVAAYTQQLRLELGPAGLHAMLVCPGPLAREDAGDRYATEAAELPEQARRAGGGVKLHGINPELLARRILKSTERRRAELVAPGRSRLLFAIAQMSPALGDWIVRRMT